MKDRLKLFEDCLVSHHYKDFRSWFYNSHPAVVLPMANVVFAPQYEGLKDFVLQQIYEMWGSGGEWNYFWYSSSGHLTSNRGGNTVAGHAVNIDSSKMKLLLRDMKLEQLGII